MAALAVLFIWLGVSIWVLHAKPTSSYANPESMEGSGQGGISYLQTFNIGVGQGVDSQVLSAVEALSAETRASHQRIESLLEDIRSPRTGFTQCESKACDNGGLLVDGVEGNSCACLRGFTGHACQTNLEHRDCGDIKKANRNSTSGVYTILLDGSTPVKAYCDMDTAGGGWLVFQKRFVGNVSFLRTWEAYAEGFGEQDGGEFWWGNRKLHILSRQRAYKLRVDLSSFSSANRFAEYSNLTIASEQDLFRIRLAEYSGDAGDNMAVEAGHAFSTVDKDNDPDARNCAQFYQGGWWYKQCYNANLNGPYYPAPQPCADNRCMQWLSWMKDSLKSSQMKIRPVSF